MRGDTASRDGPGPNGDPVRWRLWFRFLPVPAAAVLIAALVPIYFFLGLADRDLWAPDEPRYALVAQEMLRSGDYALPTTNGEVYAHKPPLLFWAIALTSRITGLPPSHGLTARLPSALAALGTVVLTALLGGWLIEPGVGLLAGLILATSHLFALEAHTAQIDSVFCFWITLSLACLVRFRLEGTSWARSGFFLACSLATLAKGPVGFVLPGLVAALWRPDRGPGTGRAGGDGPRLVTPGGLLLFAAPLLSWLVLASWRGGWPYLDQILFRHVVKRFVASWHHIRPVYYYLHDTPVNMLPWGVLLPGAIAYAIQVRRRPGMRAAIDLLGLWALGLLVIFSIPGGKRGVYMLPAFPALALLVALAVSQAAGGARAPARRLLLAGFALLPALALAALVLLPAYLRTRQAEEPADLSVLQVVLSVAVLVLLTGWTARGLLRLTHAGLLAIVLVTTALYGSFIPSLDSHKSVRPLCERALASRRTGEALAFYGHLLEAYVLYTGETLVTADSADELAGRLADHPRLLAFLQAERLLEIGTDPRFRLEPVESARIGSKNMVLMRIGPAVPGLTPSG